MEGRMSDTKDTRSGWSLRTRLLLAFVAMTAITGLITTAIAISVLRAGAQDAQAISQDALRTQAEDYLIQISQRGAREIDLVLGEIATQVENLAGYASAAMEQATTQAPFWSVEEHMAAGPDGQFMNGPDDPSSVFVPSTRPLTTLVLSDIERTAYLDLLVPEILATNPSVVAVYLGTPRDVVRYYPNIELGRVVPADFAVTSRPWYVGALYHSTPLSPVWWTEPYADATGRGLVTTAAITVRGGRGQVIGVVGFDITLNDLRASLEASQFLQTGYPFVVDTTSRAIALPSQGYLDILGRPAAADEVGPDLSASPTGFAPVLARMAAGESGFESVDVAGRQLYVAFTPLESTGWSLGSVVEAADVLAPAAQMQTDVQAETQRLLLSSLLPASVLILGAVVLLGLLLTGRYIRPLRELAQAASRLGAGELEVQVPTAGQDEVGTLARAFNAMVSQVRELITNLEQRVAARTQDLERQTRQLQVAAEIARLATESINPQELMSLAIDLIRERFDFYHASVFLMDETGTWAVLEASTGEAGSQLLARRHRLSVGSASIVGWVTANRRPRVANDVLQDPFHFRNPLLPETRAEMAVPILAGRRLLGALDLQSKTADAFQEADVRAVEAIAAELAIAFENTRRLTEAQSRLAEVQGVTRGQWRESWSRALSAETPRVFRFGQLSPSAAPSAAEIEAAHQAAVTAATVITEDGRQAATPVRVRGEVLATITVRKPHEGETWSDEEIALLEAVAGQAGMALENARQYTEERRRVVELEVVNRISQAVSQLSNPDTLYRVIHHQVSQVLGDTDFVVALYDSERETVSVPYLSEQGEVKSVAAVPLKHSLTSLVIETRQPVLIDREVSRRADELGIALEGKAPQSWLGVPMLVGEDMVGVIAVQDVQQEGRYSEDDAALLATIASQVGTALQNARLLEQVRSTARRQQLIHEITAKIRRSADVETVLATAARELSRGLTASRVVARLGGIQGADTSPGQPEHEPDSRPQPSQPDKEADA